MGWLSLQEAYLEGVCLPVVLEIPLMSSPMLGLRHAPSGLASPCYKTGSCAEVARFKGILNIFRGT